MSIDSAQNLAILGFGVLLILHQVTDLLHQWQGGHFRREPQYPGKARTFPDLTTPRPTPPPLPIKPCSRCTWLRSAKADELVLFWRPGPPIDDAAEAERIRSMALVMHAAAGHPE